MTTPTIETLQPELQTQIMRHLSSGPTLYSLLRASPRFYQVFLSRKEYLLAELARNQFPHTFANAWDAVKVSQFPRPIPPEIASDFVSTFMDDDSYLQPTLPLSTSIALCSFGANVQWFVHGFWADCLENIKRLGQLAGLRQDLAVLESPLSPIEFGRIQRALCRFATLACLITPHDDSDRGAYWRLGTRFLAAFNEDELEEIGCVRDYLIRRLWRVFDAIKDDAIQANESSPVWRMARAVPGRCWFSTSHPNYMDSMTILGLPFLREVFESKGMKRADLVMANSDARRRGIARILCSGNRGFADDDDLFDDGRFDGTADFTCDSLDDFSSGWLYANRGRLAAQHNRRSRKGYRDWGYVMLDHKRLIATGVLEKESAASTQ